MEKPSAKSSAESEVNRRERFIFIVLFILLLLISVALVASFIYVK